MAALAVFVFRCADSDLYALTLYCSGDNLPADACNGSWVYRSRLLLTRQSLETLPGNSDVAMAETSHCRSFRM